MLDISLGEEQISQQTTATLFLYWSLPRLHCTNPGLWLLCITRAAESTQSISRNMA